MIYLFIISTIYLYHVYFKLNCLILYLMTYNKIVYKFKNINVKVPEVR